MDSEIKFQRPKGRNMRQHGQTMDRAVQHQSQNMNFSAQLDYGKRGESVKPAVFKHKLKCYFVKRIINWRPVKFSRRRIVCSSSILSDPRSFVIIVYLHFIFPLVANVGKSVTFLDVI